MSAGAETLGVLAGTLTTAAFVPQVLRTWRRRSAEDLSMATFAVFALGVALWLAYGIWLALLPVIIANAVTLVLAGMLVVMKWRFSRGTPPDGA